MKHLVLALTVLLSPLTGCAVLQDHHSQPPQNRLAALRPTSPLAWRYDFGDAAFRRIQERADLNGLDVIAALARAQAADAALVAARAESAPTLGVGVGASRTIPFEGESRSNFDFSFPGNITIDPSGRLTAAIEASSAEARATGIEVDIARTGLAAELARAYLSLCSADNRLSSNQRRIGFERRALAAAKERLEAGVTGTADVLGRRQTLAILEQDRIVTLTLRRQITARIAVLSGRSPQGFVLASTSLDLLKPKGVREALHTDLVMQRLDVRAAETRLAAADLRRLEAIRATLPRITLSVGLNGSSESPGGLLAARSLTLAPALRLEGSIFDGGLSRARAKQNSATAVSAEVQYIQTRLRAEAELLDVVARRSTIEARRKHVIVSLEAAQASLNHSSQRLEAGRESRLESLDAQRVLIEAEDRFADFKREEIETSIDLESAIIGARAREREK